MAFSLYEWHFHTSSISDVGNAVVGRRLLVPVRIVAPQKLYSKRSLDNN